MKTKITTATRILSPIFVLAAMALGLTLTFPASAQTMVSGNISGTWTPSGNPYIVTDNATVPPGQTLTIQPGVTVWIAENMSITANGLIQAVGTPTQRITFQAPIASQFWSNIYCLHSAGTNRFKYCDFSNADTALRMGVYGNDATMNIEIMNSTFSNCLAQAIYGEAQGLNYADPPLGSAQINPVVKNCVFNNTSNGCVMKIFGSARNSAWYARYGNAESTIIGNIFMNLSGTAFLMSVDSYAANGSLSFVNNTIINCRVGIDATDPWDARVQDNIFVGATNAVRVSGSLTRTVSYNCFYGNATNFMGLPATYGQVILVNRNGTPSDLLYNIFQDPLFVATNDLHLAANSPCIDAGTPDWAFTDMCFPPSLGTSFPDQGAYGGPDAVNWLDTVPLLSAQASIAQNTNGIIQVSWGAIPRSEYQVQWTSNMLSAVDSNWFNVTNGWVRAVDKPTSVNVATNPPHAERYFRVRSLGRAPGN